MEMRFGKYDGRLGQKARYGYKFNSDPFGQMGAGITLNGFCLPINRRNRILEIII